MLNNLSCEVDYNGFPSICEACQMGINHILPFSLPTRTAKVPFQVMHTNVWIYAPIASFNGFKWYVHFVYEYT